MKDRIKIVCNPCQWKKRKKCELLKMNISEAVESRDCPFYEYNKKEPISINDQLVELIWRAAGVIEQKQNSR